MKKKVKKVKAKKSAAVKSRGKWKPPETMKHDAHGCGGLGTLKEVTEFGAWYFCTKPNCGREFLIRDEASVAKLPTSPCPHPSCTGKGYPTLRVQSGVWHKCDKCRFEFFRHNDDELLPTRGKRMATTDTNVPTAAANAPHRGKSAAKQASNKPTTTTQEESVMKTSKGKKSTGTGGAKSASKGNHGPKRRGSGEMIRQMLKEGKEPDAIISAVHKAFPDSKATTKDVSWHKSQMQRAKAKPAPKAAKKSKKR